MASLGKQLHGFGMPPGVLADRKEHGFSALVGQCFEHSRRMSRPWTVVESQHDFMIAQKIISLEMLESEAGSASRVDLDNAGNSEGVGIVAFRGYGGRCCRRGWGGGLPGLWPGGCDRRHCDRQKGRKKAPHILPSG